MARLISSSMVLALILGATGLAFARDSTPANEAMPSQIALTLDSLPARVRVSAQRTVDLTITTPGHVLNVPAMVLANNLAVTTTPIPSYALLSASTPAHVNFPVKWVGRDRAMGFTIVHLSIHVPALAFAPMPANASVVAVSPVVQGSTTPPRFAWANTTLGDPSIKANGIVSYLATRSQANLNGFVDAIAVNAADRVVAVLSTGHLWYSAQFVARIANIVATGQGCRARLGVKGATAPNGGALISSILPRSTVTGQMKPGDVLTTFNGRNIENWNSLLTALYLTPAGTRASITFVRDELTHHVVATLGCAL